MFSVVFQNDVPVLFVHYLPGIFGSIALVMINVVSWQDLGGLSWGWSEGGRQKMVRAWFFVSLVVAFGSVIASLWMAIEHWFNVNEPNPGPEPAPTSISTSYDAPGVHYKWPGVALILQNVLIFVSALLYRFSKPVEEGEGNMGLMG